MIDALISQTGSSETDDVFSEDSEEDDETEDSDDPLYVFPCLSSRIPLVHIQFVLVYSIFPRILPLTFGRNRLAIWTVSKLI